MKMRIAIAPAALLVALSAMPRAALADDAWRDFRFLIGAWEGKGTGAPGAGAGGFTFALDLDDKILVRKSRTDFPATADKAATSHEDLMIIHQGERGAPWQAVYFDSEGHAIRYAVTFDVERKTLTFLSEPAATVPRFRLTYTKVVADEVRIAFAIAPPGRPDDFKTYLEGTSHKVATPTPSK